VLALVGSHPGEPNSWAMDGAGEAPLEEGRLWRYLGDHGVYRCVSDPRGFMRSYSVNHFLAGRPRDVQDWRIDPVYSLNRVTKPVQTLVFIDEDDHREWNRGSWVIEPHGEQDRWIDWPGGWHTVGIQRGGDPLSYVDGHVETYWFQDPDNTLAVEAFYTPAPNSPDLYWFRDRYNPR